MSHRILAKLLLLTLLVSITACADESSVKQELLTKLPGLEVDSVHKSPIKGLYEVTSGGDVFYVDETADHIILGNMIETATKRNLTQERRDALLHVTFDTLPFKDAIKIVKGDGSRKLAIFEDPDCPFCRRLEAELSKVDNVTTYVFLYPLDQLHPEATSKSRRIWCAPDRAKAWLDVMSSGKLPDNKGDCETPIARIAELAGKLNIHGTPALVFENGRLVPGAIPQAKIEELLQASKSEAGKASHPGGK
jgi:thiol:disulfide interchange protein DsbC